MVEKSPKMSRSIFTQKLYILKYLNSRAQTGQNYVYKFKCKFFAKWIREKMITFLWLIGMLCEMRLVTIGPPLHSFCVYAYGLGTMQFP